MNCPRCDQEMEEKKEIDKNIKRIFYICPQCNYQDYEERIKTNDKSSKHRQW